MSLFGCGPDPVDRCDGVECERGICSPETGTCANPSACGEDGACLEGYACTEDARCEAPWPCADADDCDRGQCVSGACISQEICDIDQQCIEGAYCTRNGTCATDLCHEQTCDRGTCQRAGGECVNDGTCTQETEERACIEGYHCYDFNCVTETELCFELGCTEGRGVCDAAAHTCRNADDCQGDDGRCLEGYFCDGTKCEVNQCDIASSECSRGVCDPGTGDCVNAETCANPGRCLDGHYCVDGGCLEATDACQRCSGNQLCDYDGGSMEILCEENPIGCVDARDCRGDRVCVLGRCDAPSACFSDDYEPNDLSEEATDLNAALRDASGAIDASLCDGDVDVFTFETRGLGLIRGQLLVEVRYLREDIGIGELTVTVRNDAGEVVASQETGVRGFTSISLPVLAHQLGEFEIEVSASADMGIQGARYSLFADFLPTTIVNACEEAIHLEPGSVESDSRRGNSSEMGSSCTTLINYAAEDIYHLTIERTSYVDVHAIPEPEGNIDLTMSLRQSCLSAFSEIACADDHPDNGSERIGMVLDPGDYYLIIQGPAPGTGGPYTLNYSAEPVVCSPGQGRCVSSDNAEVCNSQGTGFDVLECSEGCSVARGHCDRLDGDACHVAFDATQGYQGTVFWPVFTNDYDPGSSSCVPNNSNSSATGGPDAAFYVELPSGYTLEASLTMGQVSGALYLVRDCGRVAESCVAGANARQVDGTGVYDNHLIYHNGTNGTQRFYLIADSGPSLIVDPATIRITSGPRTCEPGTARCVEDERQVCNLSGTAYTVDRNCPFGCSDETESCLPSQNDSCKGAVDIGSWGGTFTDSIEAYENFYDPGSETCSPQGFGGPDALFFVDLDAGEVIDARLQSDFDGALWVMTNCLEAAESCLASVDRFTAQPEHLLFVAPVQGRYYLVVDSQETDPRGQFTLDVEVFEPTCEAGENLGCEDGSTLSYCTEVGLPADYACVSGCSSGACGTPSGDACVDALILVPGQAVTGQFAGTNTINPGSGEVAGCYFDDSGRGPETVYAIDLEDGQRLNVQVDSGTFFTSVYLMRSCSVTQSCVANGPTDYNHTLSYDAVGNETIYVVVDRTLPSTSTTSYTLTASVQSPGCELGNVQCLDAATLGVCEANGFYAPYVCSGICDQGRCTQPRGDICADVISLQAGMEVTGNWTGTHQLDAGPGEVGACDFGTREAVGTETIYGLSLKEGEVLHAELETTATSSLLYVLKDCADSASCVAGAFSGASSLFYRANEDEEIFLVVDRSAEGTLTTSYTLGIDIEESYCELGDRFCSDDGLLLEICNEFGVSTGYGCANGCMDGRCVDPTGDVCYEAIVLETGDVVTGSFSGSNAISIPSGDNGNC
ncbi:MAG: hypothetical protein ACNA8W_13270, partial [Bradymonadaceae bacterium]